MIRYDLACACGRRFDGWFRSSQDFDAQAARGLLSCPACGSVDVSKALMAPAVATRRAETFAAPAAAPSEEASQAVALVTEKDRAIRAMLRELRAHVKNNAEDVGDRFPEMARRMHAEEIERKSIYGRATADEAKALAEEGVEVHALPRFPDDGD
ncbi:DUF1178 family protein [Methylopila turkensis]|uniref:DUF1178 domain-containing protein n=1 Tax=Methylopila turkensis TaxID=1437816 RepID=A0A9W6JNG8_9HYPH|nr:DUF1178 family protein [Methylopila turkensis]GLK79473.1 hypothetical protein GCM10008174_12140 [Methylopila turkensis]